MKTPSSKPPLSMLVLPLMIAAASGSLRRATVAKPAAGPSDKQRLEAAQAKRERRRQRNISQLKG